MPRFMVEVRVTFIRIDEINNEVYEFCHIKTGMHGELDLRISGILLFYLGRNELGLVFGHVCHSADHIIAVSI